MTPEKLAFINMWVRLGFDVAVQVWDVVTSSATIDDAIKALKESKGKTWNDYKAGELP